MRFHDRIMTAVDLAAALSQITNQLFATLELRPRWLIAIEIADQADPKGNVVQIIAVDMAAVDLPPPAVADFDLAVAGRSSIADHKMIGEPVLHPPKMPVVIIESGGVALTRSAVVHHDVLPAAARNWCAIDLRTDRAGQITVARAAA
jgi:hypothetical protein